MKFRKFLMPIIAAVIVFTACNTADKDPAPTNDDTVIVTPEKDNSVQGTIDEYFPFVKNGYYVYDRTDALLTSSTYNIYVDGNKIQRITEAGNYRVTEVLEYSNGELKVNYANDKVSCFENFLEVSGTYPMTILKEPLQIGNSWKTFSSATISGVATGTSTITDINVEIDTPLGKVLAIEVSTELENGYTNLEYYAKDLGLVKSGYFIKGFETSNSNETTTNTTKMEDVTTETTIKSFTADADYEYSIKIYYPNENADDLDNAEIKYTFDPNVKKEAIFEELLKNPNGKENERVISPNTTVNSIIIRRETAVNTETNKSKETTTVTVDLSKDFSDDMNAGSGYETLLLQALETTFKDFFRADEFILSVDGAPYVAKH